MRNLPAFLLAFSVVAAAPHVRADVSAAARAFTEGQAAQLEGDFDRAARSFELAYQITPSKEALRSAVRAHVQAGHWPRGATLAALLLDKYGSDASSAQLANEVLAEAGPKLGKVVITCAAPCTIAIDGRAASQTAAPRHIAYVVPGRQKLDVTFEGGRSVARDGTVTAGGELVYEIERPAAPPVPPSAPTPRPAAPAREQIRTAQHGLSPIVPIAGGVIALGLGGAAWWSGRDTVEAHDAYVANPTHDGWVDGRSKQLRTNILIGSAIGVGVTSIVIATVWTRWRSDRRSVAVVPGSSGGTLVLSGRF